MALNEKTSDEGQRAWLRQFVAWLAPHQTLRWHIGQILLAGWKILTEDGPLVLARSVVIFVLQRLGFPVASPMGPVMPARYEKWIAANEPDAAQLKAQNQTVQTWETQPLISVIVPVYNTVPKLLDQTLASVYAQTYPHWELIIAEGHSDRPGVREVLNTWTVRDKRIRVCWLEKNLGISGNSNAALQMAQGEFLALLDHDDLLAPFALYEVAQYLRQAPQTDMVYSDEDRINMNGRRRRPFFKPDWSPDLLQSFMYIGHLTVYRRALVEKVGGFRSEFDFSQDYDLALRVTEKTAEIGHIPQVLYHWRITAGSGAAGDKPYARASNVAALAAAVKRRGYRAEVWEYPAANRIKFHLDPAPMVSIIIPTDDSQHVNTSLNALLRFTAYPAWEVVVVTNPALKATLEVAYVHEPRVRAVAFTAPFNFSAKCNLGAEAARGEFVLFLNDDVYPQKKDWLECMVEVMQQPEVGGVSPRLVYAGGMVQYAGLVTGVRGLCGTAFHMLRGGATSYFGLLQCMRTVSVLTGACMLMRKQVFQLVGGFDAVNTPIMHSDLDLSFKIRAAGLRLVYTPFTALKHVGHASIKKVEKAPATSAADKADLYLLKRWGRYTSYDPYYPDLMRDLLYRDSPTYYRMYAADQPLAALKSRGDILCASHDLSSSGAPLVLLDLTRQFQAAGYFVTLIAPKAGELQADYQRAAVPVIIDPLVMTTPEALGILLRNYELIVANTILSWRLVLAAKKLGKPVLWLVHESQMGQELAQGNAGVREALAQADRVVFPSQQTLALYQRFAIFDNQQVMHYGIERPLAASVPVAAGEGKLRVAIVGSVEPRKGQNTLVRCIQSLTVEQRSLFEFYFVGRILDKAYATPLGQATRDLANVHWVGAVSHTEALGYIGGSDVFVCASTDETGPLVVLEAMALKRCVVSTPVGVIPEVIEAGESGLFFPTGDYQSLAGHLLHIAQNLEIGVCMGEAAGRKFEDHLILERYGREMVQLITQILSTKSA